MAIIISPDKLVTPKTNRTLSEDLIAPPKEDVEIYTAKEHDSEPIKRIEDIEAISRYFLANGQYRNNMLFIVGINFGLRVSDLRLLRFSQLIDDDLRFRTTFPVLEKKTSETRKVKRNRYITINDAVIDAVKIYLEHTPNVSLSDFMFRSESNNGANKNQPIHRNSVDEILKSAKSAVGLDCRIATHTMRKTFGYHQMLMSGNDPRKLLLLQKIFGHSSAAQTLQYIGITGEEIEQAYLDLNLGSGKRYLVDSVIAEEVFPPEAKIL